MSSRIDFMHTVQLISWAFGPVLLMALAATALGWPFVSRSAGEPSGLRRDSPGWSERGAARLVQVAESLLAGLLFFSFALLVLAFSGWLRREFLLLGLALAIVVPLGLNLRTAGLVRRMDGSRLACAARQIVDRSFGAQLVVGGVLVVSTLGAMVLLALWPPHSFDGLNYHLQFAQAFASEQRLVTLPALRFPAFPPLGELFQASALLLGGDLAAKSISLIPTLGTAALCGTWAWRRGSALAGLLTVAVWLGQPLVIWLSGQSYVEPWLVMFGVGALYAVDRYTEDGARRWLVVAMVSLAAACATKYLGIVMVGIAAAWLILDAAERRSPWPALLRQAGIAGLLVFGAGLLAAPVYWWIGAHTGNPLFPYFESLFGSAGEWSAQALSRSEAKETLGEKLAWLITLPWSVGFARQEFHRAALLSPLWLPLVLLTIWRARHDRLPRLLLLASVVFAATLLVHDERRLHHLLPPAAWLSVAAGVALAAGLRRFVERRGSWWAAALFATLLSPGLVYGWYKLADDGFPPLTESAREAWLTQRLPGYSAVPVMREECGTASIAEGSAIDTPSIEQRVREPAGTPCTTYLWSLYPLRYYLPGEVLGDFYGPYRQQKLQRLLRAPRALDEQLDRWGVTHLVVPPFRARLLMRSPTSADRFEPLWQDRQVAVLRRLERVD